MLRSPGVEESTATSRAGKATGRPLSQTKAIPWAKSLRMAGPREF